jgi:hypothetical protein
MDALAIIDEGPFWSRKLLEICGGLGHVSFTDAWSLVIQWYLYADHGLNRTRFLDQPQVYRVLHDEVDTRESDRWDTDRRINFEFIASDFYRTMVQNQARNVALNIQAAGDPQSQSCVKPTAAEMEQILLATAQGALETGNEEDAIREFREVNKHFPENLIAKKQLADLLGKPVEEQSAIAQAPTPPEAPAPPKAISKSNFTSTLEAALQL